MATLRYRTARDAADQLGQVFTPPGIATLLANSMPVPRGGVHHILDLGAGAGALTRAALTAHPRASAQMVEVDKRVVRALRGSLPSKRAVVSCADALGSRWTTTHHASWILSNPPYGNSALTPNVRAMLETCGLSVPMSGDWVRGDVAFVARIWGLAQIGVGIGLIVSSPIIRDAAFAATRQRLVEQMRGLCVTQLEETTFANTEVRAYLIAGMRAASRRRSVILRKADASGAVVAEMAVSYHEAMRSLDYDFHYTMRKLGVTSSNTVDTLGSIGVAIVRGSRSQRDFDLLGLRAFHTTDFDEHKPSVRLDGASRQYQTARSGHILIPRVGSRCLARQTRVKAGEGLFTECVYRLTVKPKDQSRVWKTLTSSFGAEWRMANAAGSCAKHLTVRTLSTMPLIA